MDCRAASARGERNPVSPVLQRSFGASFPKSPPPAPTIKPLRRLLVPPPLLLCPASGNKAVLSRLRSHRLLSACVLDKRLGHCCSGTACWRACLCTAAMEALLPCLALLQARRRGRVGLGQHARQAAPERGHGVLPVAQRAGR